MGASGPKATLPGGQGNLTFLALCAAAVCVAGLATLAPAAEAKKRLPVNISLDASEEDGHRAIDAIARSIEDARCDLTVDAKEAHTDLPRVETDAKGRAHWTWVVPDEAPQGKWIFRASCERGKRKGSAAEKLLVLTSGDGSGTELVVTQTLEVGGAGGFACWTDGSSNQYCARQCTWYVKNQYPEVPNGWGNARFWDERARGVGWEVGGTPRVGAIAVWEAWGYVSTGHVAIVKETYGDGSFRVREHNWSVDYGYGEHNTSTGPAGSGRPSSFICPPGRCAAAPPVDPPGPPTGQTGHWFARFSNTSGGSEFDFAFGNPGDAPIHGDWDLDGQGEPGGFRNGSWFLRGSNTSGAASGPDDLSFAFASPGDYPLLAQVDNDPALEPCVWREGSAHWFCRFSLSSGASEFDFAFGNPGDLPVMGDIDQDGQAEPVLYRPGSGTWFFRNSNTSGGAEGSFAFGNPGDYPLLGQVDDDPALEPCIWRPSSAHWFCRFSLSSGASEFDFAFGNPADVPLMGDVDGDSQTEPILFR